MTPDTRQHLVDLALAAVRARLADDPDVSVVLAELDRLSGMVAVLTPTARAELEHQAGLPARERGVATVDVWAPKR